MRAAAGDHQIRFVRGVQMPDRIHPDPRGVDHAAALQAKTAARFGILRHDACDAAALPQEFHRPAVIEGRRTLAHRRAGQGKRQARIPRVWPVRRQLTT